MARNWLSVSTSILTGSFLSRARFPSSSYRVALSLPHPESRPSKPDVSNRDICSGVQTIRFLENVFCDCSLRLHPWIILDGFVFFLGLERLLSGGRSRDFVFFHRSERLLLGGRSRYYTANHFLHRLRSATSSNALMSTSANGVIGAFSIGPSAWYDICEFYH